MDTEETFLKKLLEEVEELFSPVIAAAEGEGTRDQLFEAIGWDLNVIPGFPIGDFATALTDFKTAYLQFNNLVVNPPQDIEGFRQSLQTISSLMTSVRNLKDIAVNSNITPQGILDIGVDLIEHLTLKYFERKWPVFYNLAVVLTIIESQEETVLPSAVIHSNVMVRYPRKRARWRLDRLGQLLTDPATLLNNEYYPYPGNKLNSIAEATQTADKLFPRLVRLFLAMGLYSRYGRGTTEFDYGVDGNQAIDEMLVTAIPISTSSFLAFSLALSPPQRGDLGLVLKLYGAASLVKEIGNWEFDLMASAALPGFSYGPHGLELPSPVANTDLYFDLIVSKTPTVDNVAFLFGSETGTRLKIGRFRIIAEADFNPDANNFGVVVKIDEGALIIMPGDGDNFLKKVIPPQGMEVEFELAIGWSNQTGFYIKGSGSLEIRIPVHKRIFNIIDLNDVLVSIKVVNDDIRASLATSGSLVLGPVNVSLKDIGLNTDISFPQGGGNLGPANGDLNFKAPTGAGIAIDGDQISGGGFLNFDEATKTYTGGLELNFSKISLKAVGIISTQLPGGEEGYSLLVIISAEFQPIQLGLGFTLNGVGGMLGLHRTMNVERLRTGIRDNTLDSILFPQNIVQNANTIISNLNQVFPIQQDRFVFGPMAKIAWGTPAIITLDMGLVIEIPNPVTIAILGVLRSILPDKDNAVLTLQVNFLGLIEFEKKQLSIDASLFNSKVLSFPLTGDMAVRLSWGEKPSFLVSAGGFHPQYTPPPMNLPTLRRMCITLADEENFKARIESYFAVTSNAAMFGARLEAYAAAGKFNAQALLWFDILFRFQPFYFIANMGAMVAIRKESENLLSALLDLTLEGPSPWRARGTVSFEILGIDLSISFDKTFGEVRSEVLAPVPVWTKFSDALSHKDNWSAPFPGRNSLLVTLRELSLPQGTLLVEPFGNLTFNQKVVPLDITYTKVGTAPPADYKMIRITAAKDANNNPLAKETEKDFFARSEYFYMSDQEKLSRDAFEKFNSGVKITGTEEISSSYYVRREFEYETITIDRRIRTTRGTTAVTASQFDAQLMGNSTIQSPLSNTLHAVPIDAPSRVTVKDNVYTVAVKSNLLAYGTPVYFDSYTEAENYYANVISIDPSQEDELMVINVSELY